MNKRKGRSLRQAGQVVLILVLVMTVALAIGISVIQRSLSDISTSSQVEQSSRAFSAAEAGIEKALSCPTCVIAPLNFENQSVATVTNTDLKPPIPAGSPSPRQDPLEYPSLTKEEAAHIWLADYNSTSNPPPAVYKQTALDVYWGDPSASDKAALEVTLVYFEGSTSRYLSRKWLLDNSSATRTPANNFCQVSSCLGGYTLPSGITYQCKFTLGDNSTCSNSPLPGFDNSSFPSSPSIPMLLRVRPLYSATPIAVQPPFAATCGQDCSLPPQARNIDSVGSSGATQRKVRLFQSYKAAPAYFDYAIFSVGGIIK